MVLIDSWFILGWMGIWPIFLLSFAWQLPIYIFALQNFDVMKDRIIAYLQGPRAYRQGVNLYEEFGRNLMLKATFRRSPETELLRSTLFDELRKLAGMTETEFKSMQRKAVTVSTQTEKEASENTARQSSTGGNVPASETTKKMVKFRDRFPFLREESCPDVLKVIVADMFAAYDAYVKAFNDLQALPDDVGDEQSMSYAAAAVENYLEDRTIWAELEYYKEKHVLLGDHPKVAAYLQSGEMSLKGDLEVVSIRRNAATNISKWKKKLAAADTDEDKAKAQTSLEKWILVRDSADAILNERKKN